MNNSLAQSCIAKAKKVRSSGKLFAVLGYLLGEQFTNPHFIDLAILDGGHVLGNLAGDIGLNEFIGAESDLRRNIEGFADAAQFTPEEKAFIISQVDACRR